MKAFVTGGTGFLGRAVVRGLLDAGVQVRALVRPGSRVTLPAAAQLHPGDLRSSVGLESGMVDCDVAVHLAACVLGSDSMHYATTVGGTETLLRSMRAVGCARLVLAGSFSVYDWLGARGRLDERTPMDARIEERGAYALAKLWQERLAQREVEACGLELQILRPGVIWGPGQPALWVVGPVLGGTQWVISPGRALPLTFVENCADAFVAAVRCPGRSGTWNVVDDERISAGEFWGSHRARISLPPRTRSIPYFLASAVAGLATWSSRALFGPTGKLPSLLIPSRLAIYRPLAFPNGRLRSDLLPVQRVSYSEAMERSYAPVESPG